MSPNLHRYVLGSAILLAVALVGAAYLNSHANVVRADQVKQDMKPVHEEAQQQVQAAQADKDSTAKALSAALAMIAAQKQQPVDYDRIRQMIKAELPGMDVKVEGAKDAKGNALPDAPSSITISGQGAAQQVNDAILGCKESNIRVGACEKMLGDTETQFLNEKKDHIATKAELDAANKAMRGGGFWRRLKSNSKWFIIGGAAGAATTVILKH